MLAFFVSQPRLKEVQIIRGPFGYPLNSSNDIRCSKAKSTFPVTHDSVRGWPLGFEMQEQRRFSTGQRIYYDSQLNSDINERNSQIKLGREYG